MNRPGPDGSAAAPAVSYELDRPGARLRAHLSLLFADHGFFRVFVRNFHEVAPGVFRSNQPSPGKLRKAARIGVRTVINLRGTSPKPHYRLEREACAKAGLRLVDFQVRSRDLPSRETLHAARALFEDVDYPILMHCKSGADRAGIMSALYLIIREGRPVEEAMGQLHWRFGHYRSAKTGVLDHFLAAYRDHRDATGEDFFTWVDGRYDPGAITSAFHAGRWTSLIVDRLLRRE